ncbi:ELWxxDGT repeat protein [Rapidithrix thailandica]|uniref:ELWxxDGT repeat protein n=1 Tax=Rapidithrix thailandica TaxID=413964 RepID=A0AAW9SK42_9BACT
MKRLFLLLLFLFPYTVLQAQQQLTEITYRDGNGGSSPENFIEFNGLMFFIANSKSEGKEIWVSDGTKENTQVLKDVYPGPESSIFDYFLSSPILEQISAVLNNKLYFIANDGQNGPQIWVTDGTRQETKRITNVPNFHPSRLTVVGENLFMISKKGDLLEVWKSDGTNDGTVLVKGDIPSNRVAVIESSVNNLFVFAHSIPMAGGYNVWRSDGSEAGTFPILQNLQGSASGLSHFIEFQNELYFVARKNTQDSSSLLFLKSNGLNAIVIKEVNIDQEWIDFEDVIKVNNKLYFSFYKFESNHFFIWESDGTAQGTRKVHDETGGKYFIPSNLSTDGNHLIFTSKNINEETALLRLKPDTYELEEIKTLVTDPVKPYFFSRFDINDIQKIKLGSYLISFGNSQDQKKYWKTDFSTANTSPITNIPVIGAFFHYKNQVYFSGYSEAIGYELWNANLDFTNPQLFADINTSRYGLQKNFGRFQFTELNDKLLFSADDGVHGNELWTYNSSTNTSHLVKDIFIGENSSGPSNFISYNNSLYFTANNENGARRVWKSDGTEAGTTMINDLSVGFNAFTRNHMTFFQNKILFISEQGGNHVLFAINGENIEMIKNFGEYIMNIEEMVVSGNKVFFYNLSSQGGIWVSDGTEMGSFKIKDLYSIRELTAFNGKVFFSAAKEQGGEIELWQSDGTLEGTKMVKDIGMGYSSEPDDLVSFNEKLIFTTYTEETGREFWVSDGTAESTVQLIDINPGRKASVLTKDYNIITSLYRPKVVVGYTELNGFLYFTANDGVHGTELWRTDGTPAGTTLVSDINEGAYGSIPRDLTSHEGKLYFSAYTEESGVELWISEGTDATTLQLYDVIRGPESSLPSHISFINDEIYFIAETENHGRQLWKGGEDSVTGIEDWLEDDGLKVYPNPTSEYLMFEHSDWRIQQVKIVNMQGQTLSVQPDATNKIYVGNLPSGMYLLIAEADDQKLVKKFIKE